MDNQLRIAFISRPSLFTVRGGDTVQMTSTASALRSLGVQVDIFTSNQTIDYAKYDLLHFFNIIRPASILHHTSKSGLPYVLSPVYVEYAAYEETQAHPVRRILASAVGKHRMEYIKVLGRYAKSREPIGSFYYLSRGHYSSIRKVLQNCSYLLPNSESEGKRLLKDFPTDTPWKAVPNGADTELFRFKGDALREKNTVLCSARIEGRKNQLGLIRALRGTGIKLWLAGKAAPNHSAYYEQCVSEADENVTFLGQLDFEDLVNLYHRAEVHAMPSWFETTGLSSLEAALCGSKLVMSRLGDEYDYFQDDVHYAKPDDIQSIRQAVLAALDSQRSDKLRERILRDYTWGRCAELTLQAYKEVLK
ncbi:MAG: glycosyltransferase [Bacteroidetes bacterium]|nr:MAG: glycosyltransferase [Bacteroidota bacterium]